jgi:hypothetical protein
MSLRDKEVGVVVKLCAKCQSLLDNWELPENRSYPHSQKRSYRCHDNNYEFNALEASAKGGCQLCGLFAAGFSEHALRTLRVAELECCFDALVSLFLVGTRHPIYKLRL